MDTTKYPSSEYNMDLYNAGDVLRAQEEFMIILEKNKYNPEITNPILILTYKIVQRKCQTELSMSILKEMAMVGNSYAQNQLGEVYYIQDNLAEAFKMFELSANQQNTAGQFNLGYMYYRGRGCTQNILKCFDLFTLSIDGMCAPAKSYFDTSVLRSYKPEYDTYMKDKKSKAVIKRDIEHPSNHISITPIHQKSE